MPDSGLVMQSDRIEPDTAQDPPHKTRPAWLPVWSVPAAMRALRAVLVIPALFALTDKGIGNTQMALFAAFGGFASLVMVSFGGTRRDKAVAHLMLAVTGSIALIIGTAVCGTTWLATIVTIPVTFLIFFAGVAGPNAASGVTAALLAYVLPVASSGTVSMIPDRLAGWWLAAAVSTVAVLVLSTPSAGDRLRTAAAALARALADELAAAVRGEPSPERRQASVAAKHELISAFVSTPIRPTGLATADQAMASVIQELEWCSALIFDAIDGHLNLNTADPVDRDLLRATASVLGQTAALLGGADVEPNVQQMMWLRQDCVASRRPARRLNGDRGAALSAKLAFHAQTISVAAQALVGDALIAMRRADPETIAARRRSWVGAQPEGTEAERRVAALSGAIGFIARHASFRSVWFLNSLRGSLALAAAVLVADLSSVEHAFWVVLGTLSVLRTNASSTESTALRALGGTVIGFAIGALLLLGIGTSEPALWAALPIALAVAAYAPGTLPFAFGQAGFTIVVVVLFNLLVPVGWKVGLLRVEDVAIGCLVSVVVGFLFWPRGAASVVGDDLADAFRRGAAYLVQSVEWALGSRQSSPEGAAAAITAGTRLDEALRGYLAEQGAKRVPKEELWRLVMATQRLRLTAYSLAGLHATARMDGPARTVPALLAAATARGALTRTAADLADFYERIAVLVGRPVARQVLAPIAVPVLDDLEKADGQYQTPAHYRHLLWVGEHLAHLGASAATITKPAFHVAELRRLPWWR